MFDFVRESDARTAREWTTQHDKCLTARALLHTFTVFDLLCFIAFVDRNFVSYHIISYQ